MKLSRDNPYGLTMKKANGLKCLITEPLVEYGFEYEKLLDIYILNLGDGSATVVVEDGSVEVRVNGKKDLVGLKKLHEYNDDYIVVGLLLNVLNQLIEQKIFKHENGKDRRKKRLKNDK